MRSPLIKILVGVVAFLLILPGCNLPVNFPVLPPTLQATPLKPMLAVQASPTAAPLPVVASPEIVSLAMLDVRDGWALSDSAVLHTGDGGRSWQNATPPGVTSVGASASSFFLDAATGWVVLPSADFTSGTLYHTTDGGSDWTSAPVPFSGGSLQFLDISNGAVLAPLGAGAGSEAVAIFLTSDGGTTWTRTYVNDPTVAGAGDSLPLSGMKNGLTLLDIDHGWVSGSEPMNDFIYIYRTSDGGRSWVHQDLNLPSGFAGATASADAPRFFNATQGILPVSLFSNTIGTVFYLTHDGGATWTPTKPVTPTGHYSIASPADFFVWDGGTSMYVSHDSGSTWSSVSPNISVQDSLVSFQFVDPTTGWTLTSDANNHHTLYQTSDGGNTWTALIP